MERNVHWVDMHGYELAQVREFEPRCATLFYYPLLQPFPRSSSLRRTPGIIASRDPMSYTTRLVNGGDGMVGGWLR